MRTLAEIVPLRTPACREAADAVVMLAAGEDGPDRSSGEHVASCLRCQAEVAAFRRVLAIMRSMRDDLQPLPGGALGESLDVLHSDALHSGLLGDGAALWAVRAACVGGLTAASAAGMLVWLSRRRLGLPHAS